MINKLIIVLQHIHRRQEVSKLRSQKNGKCHWSWNPASLDPWPMHANVTILSTCVGNVVIWIRSLLSKTTCRHPKSRQNSWKLALAVIWNSIPNSLDFKEISYNATSANIRHLEIRDAWEEKYLEHNHKATNCTWFYTFSLQLKMWILSTASLNN